MLFHGIASAGGVHTQTCLAVQRTGALTVSDIQTRNSLPLNCTAFQTLSPVIHSIVFDRHPSWRSRAPRSSKAHREKTRLDRRLLKLRAALPSANESAATPRPYRESEEQWQDAGNGIPTPRRRRWQALYGSMVRQLERDLPELLSFFSFPRHLRRKLRTTNLIERCFVEVRRRTRPMVCFVNVKSVDRIIYSIFQRFNLEWKTRTLRVFTQAT